MPDYLLQLSGELGLKDKRTRHRFVDRLVHNLADALKAQGLSYEIERRWSRVLLSASSSEAATIASRVFGVRAVAAMEKRTWQDLDDLLDQGQEIFTPEVAGRTFAVRVHRGEHAKTVPFTSPQAERALGARLAASAAGVDLDSPEVEAHVELRGDEAYFYGRRMLAEGGLPIGTGGRALALFSGGFDSPVAAWSILRRGVQLDYLFFNLGDDAHVRDVARVAKVLADRWSYGSRPRLVVVDFKPIALELHARSTPAYWQILLKRQMLRAAAEVAKDLGALALVSGEAIGQVSSQTLHNLALGSRAVELPILRPLVASNKEEILALARRIGSHDLSLRVPEYCGLGGRGRPVTEAKADVVERQESAFDPELLADLLGRQAILDLCALDASIFEVESSEASSFNAESAAAGNASDSVSESIEVGEIPKASVLLDLRSPRAFKDWHPRGAVHLAFPEALESFRQLDPGPLYVLYCEVGMKSAQLGVEMRAAGYRVRQVRGGWSALAQHARAADSALLAAMSPAWRDEAGEG